jgi:hypothetical protein
MGDKAGKVLKIVGVVALGIATFGIGSFIAFGGAAGIIGGVAAYGGLLLAGASLIGLANSLPKSVDETGANSRGTPHADAGSLASYMFGRTLSHMPLLYEEQTGESPDRLLHNIYVHAWHRISAYVSLTVPSDDGPEVVSFSGDAATGDFFELVWWHRQDGTQTTALSGSPFFDNNLWPSTAVAKGMAVSGLVWNVDDDRFAAKFSGMPSRAEVVIDGAFEYDPRLDTTAGGSGTHRFATPGTWKAPTGNAILVLLRFMIGEYADDGSLIWGRGVEEAEYDADNFMAMAAVADETRDGKPSFRLGGAHLLDGSWEGFVAQWEQETGGKVSKAGGVYRVWLPHDDLTPLTTISETDLLAGASIEHVAAGSVDQFYNTGRGRYIDPTQGYKAFGYPEVVEAPQLAEDGGRKRVLVHDFSWVQDVEIAQRTVRLKIRRSRFQRAWTVPIGWMGHSPNYRPFTVHTLNCAETNFEDQLVRVVDRRLSFKGPCVLVVQQEDESLYDDTVPLLDPHANNTIPKRIDRGGVITPRGVVASLFQDFDAGPFNMSGTGPIQGGDVTTFSPSPQAYDCNLRVTLSWDEEFTNIAGSQFTRIWCETDTGNQFSDEIPVNDPASKTVTYLFTYVGGDTVELHFQWGVNGPAGPNDADFTNVRWTVEFVRA